MVIYVVKAAFVPLSVIGESPVNAGVARLCGVSPYPVPDTATALPKQARYQLRNTPIFSFLWLPHVFPKQARYQLRYTRICSNIIAGECDSVQSLPYEILIYTGRCRRTDMDTARRRNHDRVHGTARS